jgi:hypothetical protein
MILVRIYTFGILETTRNGALMVFSRPEENRGTTEIGKLTSARCHRQRDSMRAYRHASCLCRPDVHLLVHLLRVISPLYLAAQFLGIS